MLFRVLPSRFLAALVIVVAVDLGKFWRRHVERRWDEVRWRRRRQLGGRCCRGSLSLWGTLTRAWRLERGRRLIGCGSDKEFLGGCRDRVAVVAVVHDLKGVLNARQDRVSYELPEVVEDREQRVVLSAGENGTPSRKDRRLNRQFRVGLTSVALGHCLR